MFCTRCAGANDEGAVMCVHCGARLPLERVPVLQAASVAPGVAVADVPRDHPTPDRSAGPYPSNVGMRPGPGRPRTTRVPTNSLAIGALLFAIFWFYWIGTALAIVMGIVALKQIGRSGGMQRGKTVAVVALVLAAVEAFAAFGALLELFGA